MATFGRRAFISGSAAASVARPARAIKSPILRVTPMGSGIIIEADGAKEKWTINASAICPTAEAEVIKPLGSGVISTDTECLIELRGVALSSGISPVIRLQFMPLFGIWKVRAVWSLLPGGGRLTSNWIALDNLGASRLSANTSGWMLYNILHALAGEIITSPRSASLEIGRALDITIQAKGGEFACADGAFRINRIALSPAPAGQYGIWRCAGILNQGAAVLGTTSFGTRVELRPDAASQLVITNNEIRVFGDLHLSARAAGQPLFMLPCGAIRALPKAGAWSFQVPLHLAGWEHTTRYATIGLETPPQEAKTGTVERPVEITVTRRQVTEFAMQARALHVNIAVDEASRTRFDLGHQPMRLGLRRVPGEADIVLDDPGLPLYLDLERASLSVVRAADLLALKFQFGDMRLELGKGPAAIVPKQSQPPSADVEIAGPVLVAEFPPQHILEQAFLRQQRPLPDAGAPITDADISILRRPSAAADKRRKEISDRKRQEERDQDAGETPFARFADAWNAKEPKLWIGPDGLFSVVERQKARAFYSDYLTKEFRDADQALANSDPLGVENALKRLQLRSDVFAPDLLSEAIARNPNARSDWEQRLRSAMAVARDDGSVDEVQREWEAWRDKPTNNVVDPYKSLPFFTATWPFDKQRAIIFDNQTKPQPLPPAITAGFLRHLLGEALSSIVSEPELEVPVEAKLSGPSRLAFRVPSQRCFPLSLKALTNWRELELSVVQRAYRFHKPGKSPDLNENELVDDIGEILQSQGILPGDHTGPDRLRQIQATLTAPRPYHTSLEIPSRLFLSPAQDVRFITGSLAPKQYDVINPVWQARLVEDRFPASLRAVWSPDFDPAAFAPDLAKQRHPQPGLYPNFDGQRAPLDSADRHDFVALSSVYGLPVIVTKGSPKRPEGYEFEGDNEADPKGPGPQGIYTPVALATRLLTLSSVGGTLDHDTSFPPFSAWRDSGVLPLFASSSLQRWRSLIVDGRDVIATVVRRGYLFPLGHRASLIKVTEPRIRARNPDDPRSGYVAAQSTRIYIEVTSSEQVHPLPGQANLGRGFPARRVRLLTKRSPDLLDAFEDPLIKTANPDEHLKTGPRGRVQGAVSRAGVAGPLAGRVFWPRTKPGPAGTVQWRMLIDDSTGGVSFPLLFVDHQAASDPETLEALCGSRYYGFVPGASAADIQEMPENWWVMNHSGAARSYADERKKGDCTFVTDWQEIGAEGREGGGFNFNAALLSAGQPPFYPKMPRAQVRPQQLQGLTGQSAPKLTVEYVGDYVAKGFVPSETGALDSALNLRGAGQNFLRLIGRDPYPYDMGVNGDRAGGVARPATAIRYWNRVLGPVGEPQPPKPSGQANASPATGAQATDVLSFLNGLFSEKAKLLGLIGLREFVEKLTGTDEDALRKAMPQLTETADFIDSGLANVAGDLSAKITPVLEQAQKLGKSGPGHGLADSLEVLKGILDNFPQHEPEKVPATLSQVWSVGQRALGAMEAIDRAPVAAIGAFVSGQLKSKLDDLIKDQPQKVWQELPKQFGQLLKRAIYDNSKTSLARLLFPVPFLPGSDGTADPDVDAVANAVDRAIANVTWDAPDPLRQVLQQVAADPLLKAIGQQKLQSFVAAVQDTPLYRRFAQLATQASETADTVITEAAEDVVGLWEATSRIQAMLGEQASQICDAGFGLMKSLTDAIAPNLAVCAKGAFLFPDSLCKQLDDAQKKLTDIDTKIGDAINQSGSDTERITLQQFQSYIGEWSHFVREFRDRSDEVAINLGKIRDSVLGAFGNGCIRLRSDEMNVLAELQAVRAEQLLKGFEIPKPPAGDVPGTIKSIMDEANREMVSSLSAMVERAATATLLRLDPADTVYNELESAADASGVAAENTKQIVQNLRNVSIATRDRLTRLAADQLDQTSADLVANLDKNADDLKKQLDDLLEAAVLAAAAPVLKDIPELEKIADQVGNTLSALLSAAYDGIIKARDAARAAVDSLDLESAATAAFGTPEGGSWTSYLLVVQDKDKRDQLVEEYEASKDPTNLRTLLDRWKAGRAAPQLIIGWIQDFGVLASKLRLLDFNALRQQLEQELGKLVPKSKVLSNTLNLPLHPINVANVVDFKPTVPDASLALSSIVTAALSLGSDVSKLPATPHFSTDFHGAVSPFVLDILDVVRVNFRSGITYAGSSGQSPVFKAPLSSGDITFGGQLSFVADLASVLSMGGDQGPYSRVRADTPAIEAGYRLLIESFTLGITFRNINIGVGLLLPFNDDKAKLAANFGSIDTPVMISAGIYGGSCYLGFTATAAGIDGYSAAFEFGGVAALGYGPLNGVAYVTTGAWIRKESEGKVSFTALFSAGFSAHIACFAISASFVLRLEKDPGSSSISGMATLTFSFKVGFFTVSYSVSVHRGMSAGFGGGDASAAGLWPQDGRVMFAQAGHGPLPPFLPQRAQLITVGYDAALDWSAYAAQFDHDFSPAEETW